MFKKSKINKKSLNQLKERFQWKGTGHKTDPIIIDSFGNLEQIIKLKNIESHILIKDIYTCEIRLINCKNIKIENCQIFRIKFVGCQGISVQNCEIYQGIIRYCRECNFKNNVFDTDFSDFFLTESGREVGDNTMRLFQKIFIVLPFFGYFWAVFLTLVGGLIDGIFTFLFACVFFYPFIVVRIKRSSIKGFGPNSYENNRSDELEDLRFRYRDYGNHIL